ncbi:MAG TPA: transketolase C-terminal domain-containing protein, partial [Ginsengibacter sp.]|nr:transketolase C-terminal domain-containing protein [Ginsengibacter sp.]
IITYGMGVIWATQYAAAHPDISPDILDLRTLVPLDYKAIRETVRNTGKVLVLHEDTMTGGFGGEIAAWIAQNCFEYLDAPVMRCASLDTPVPFNRELEDQFLAQSRLDAMLEKLMNY